MHTDAVHIGVALDEVPGLSDRFGIHECWLTALHRLKNGMGPYGMADSGHPTLSALDASICTLGVAKTPRSGKL